MLVLRSIQDERLASFNRNQNPKQTPCSLNVL
jgi:hypothetical protein